MAKVYTAQEMRLTADYMHTDYAFALIPVSNMHMTWREVMAYEVQEMLRQAADALEREEKRVKKYEYAVRWDDGYVEKIHTDYIPSKDEVLDVNKVLRREVGEWEEVKDA